MLRSILLLLTSCASSPEPASPGYDYGGLRKPDELQPKVEQTQPVVPPPAKQDESPPKKDPCIGLCALDRDCDQLATSCQKMLEEQGHMNGATCKQKNRVCQRVITHQAAINRCDCE